MPPAGREELIFSGLPDAPSWWGDLGRPGFAPDLDQGVGYPWTLAGHVRGGWSVTDASLPELGPFPGVVGAQTPLGWMDSLAVETWVGSAWDGFEGSLARARVWREPLPLGSGRRPRAVSDLALASGSSAYDGNALSVTRGDSLTRWIVGATSWNRGGLGTLGPAGRHHGGAATSWIRGRHRVDAVLGQAGSAAGLATGEEQNAAGAGGSLRYRMGLERFDIGLELARGYDHHESFGGLLPGSRRDAHQRRATGEISGRSGEWGARLDVRDATVIRANDGLGESERRAGSVWAAARLDRRRGGAGLHAALGAGRHGAVGGTQIAPAAAFDFAEAGITGRAYLGRLVVPVWTDLAQGVEPFLQRTWIGGFSLGWRRAESAVLETGWTMGRTRDRALVTPWPFEELWLRDGFRPGPGSYDFGLATGSGRLRWRSWVARGEAYVLFRDASATEAYADPRRGGRASLETGFRAFTGDLGVRLRGEVELVGGRVSRGPTAAWISGYATTSVVTGLTLADASVVVAIRNLEDQAHRLPWLDPLTGEEALGPGMEFRLALTWRLYN